VPSTKKSQAKGKNMERKERCQNQEGMDCRGCEVAVEVAQNVVSHPRDSVVGSMTEVTSRLCPEGTKFKLYGDLRELLAGGEKVIQLGNVDGRPKADRELPGAAEAAL